jgi:hypothetical protein
MLGCDKTTPACLMGACSTKLPTIVVSGGPMLMMVEVRAEGWAEGYEKNSSYHNIGYGSNIGCSNVRYSFGNSSVAYFTGGSAGWKYKSCKGWRYDHPQC